MKIDKRTASARACGFVSRRHETRCRQGDRHFIEGPRAHKNRYGRSLRIGTTNGDVFRPGPSEDAKTIEVRVQASSEDQLLARYHDLVDLGLERSLKFTERFELERIEARLDYQDKDELERTAAMRKAWEVERGELVASLERLLAGFRAAR